MNTNYSAQTGEAMLRAPGNFHPRKVLVPPAVGLAWGDDGAIYQEKLDGKFTVREWRGHTVAGELMPGGEFMAWDLLATEGCDCRSWRADSRWNKLNILAREGLPWRLVEAGAHGGELLARVLGRGGEGVVRKLPHATYWDAMEACKRGGVWLCQVKSLGATQSVEIADAATGSPRGKVALRGGKCDQVRPGSIIRVEGLGLTAAGKIREPRPCREWLVQF